MVETTAVVDDTTPDLERWQRWQARWLGWMAADPRRSKVLVGATVAAMLLVVVASLVEAGFGRGTQVWWWCTILVWWLVLTPTRTVRWSPVLRMFSLAVPWAVVIAVASTHGESDGVPLVAAREQTYVIRTFVST